MFWVDKPLCRVRNDSGQECIMGYILDDTTMALCLAELAVSHAT